MTTKKAAEETAATRQIDPNIPAIYAAMGAIMADVEAVSKDSKNDTQKWSFRGIDAAYKAIHPLLARHGVITVPRVLEGMRREQQTTRSGGVIFYTIIKVEYDFVSTLDGSKITVGPMMGEAMDAGDKSCNKCMAVAHKYAIFQTFCVPTDKSDDPDDTSYDIIQPDFVPPNPLQAPVPPTPYGAFVPPAGIPAQVFETDRISARVDPISGRVEVGNENHPGENPPQAPVVNPSAAPEPQIGDAYIEDEAGAIQVADFMIGMVQNMQWDSLQALASFYQKNLKALDQLDTNYNAQYLRVKAAFTARRQTFDTSGAKQ